MFRYGHFGYHHGPGLIGWLLFALFLAAVVVAVLAVVRLWRHPAAWRGTLAPAGPTPASPVDPALTELRLRYARGDLTWEEFAQRAANLGFHVTPPAGPASPPPPPTP